MFIIYIPNPPRKYYSHVKHKKQIIKNPKITLLVVKYKINEKKDLDPCIKLNKHNFHTFSGLCDDKKQRKKKNAVFLKTRTKLKQEYDTNKRGHKANIC